MSTPRLAGNHDYPAEDNEPLFFEQRDLADERPVMQDNAPDMQGKIDATLPSRLLGPTGDVEAAVQRGMATVRRLLDAHEAGEYPEYHPAGTGQRIIELEARVAELEAELLPLLDLDECQPVRDMEGTVLLTPVQAVRALGDFWLETADEVQRLGARVQELEAERARLVRVVEAARALYGGGISISAINRLREALAALDAGEGRDG